MKNWFKNLSPRLLRNFFNEVNDFFAEEVIVYYNRLIKIGKVYPDYLYRLTILYLYLGDKKKAEETLDLLISKNDRYQKYIQLRDFIKKGKNVEGLHDFPTDVVNYELLKKLYDECEINFENKPFYFAVFFEIVGVYALNTLDYDNALYAFLISFFYSKDLGKFYYYIGYLHYIKGFIESAFISLKLSMEQGNEDVNMLLEFSHISIEKNDMDTALDVLLKIYKKHPTYPDVLYRIGNIYYLRNDIKKAKEFLIKAVKVNDRYESAHMLLFAILFEEEDFIHLKKYVDELKIDDFKRKFIFFVSLKFNDKVQELDYIDDEFLDEIVAGIWDHILIKIPKERVAYFLKRLFDEKLLDSITYSSLLGRFKGNGSI